MLVTLYCGNKIYRVKLPGRIQGKYWMTDDEGRAKGKKFFSIEADTDAEHWIIRKQRTIVWHNEKSEGQDFILRAGCVVRVFVTDLGEGILFTEPVTENRRIFRKYVVSDGAYVSIGRDRTNSIVYENQYVSAQHAALEYSNGKWTVRDLNSGNGTYVNRIRTEHDFDLKPGDVIEIMGLRIIVGRGLIALNDPDGEVSINDKGLRPYHRPELREREEPEPEQKEFFYRSPRFRKEIEPLKLKVDMPTQREDRNEQPILLTIGSALIMGLASFSVAILSMLNSLSQGRELLSALPTMISASAMLVGVIFIPVLLRKRERKMRAEKEGNRRDRYLKYIGRLRDEISNAGRQQKDYLLSNYPLVTQYAASEEFWKNHLWERTEGQQDFLELRLGAGNTDMEAEIQFPDDRFSVDDDIMRDELFAFQKEERLLMDVPILFSLRKDRVLGIIGEHSGVIRLLQGLLLQIILFHSYDEVKLIVLCDKADEKDLDFLRYTRHIWDNNGKQRFLAMNEDDLRELSIIVNGILADRRQPGEEKRGNATPFYVIISTSSALSRQCDFLQEVLKDDNLSGFGVICAHEESSCLPKECRSVIETSESQGILMSGQANADQGVSFVQDQLSCAEADYLAGKMARYELNLNIGRYDLPESVGFMELFGAGKCEHLNVLDRWKKNNPVNSIKAPVGVDTLGSVFYLDLHEKFHGPHGLIAGMTGSGKSEFIITYILSMAVNYHPDEVGFVLIDYKGGGLAGAFENEKYRLPHLVGTITNLDSGSVMRSILSIKSELRRRQAIFNQARVIAREGTMDIYKYQKMYRDGQVKEPLPHLFIIADEFAELKSQQPEFLDQLISTARIGRSLGVHLILATQKPAGVVSDQIWANSRFKVCLKVQDKADSNDMLKRPDAAELKETGRFYLQVGYNELFEMGQSAWSGAPYADSDDAEKTADMSMEILDSLGNVVEKLKKEQVRAEVSNSQIVRIMEYLNALAMQEQICTRQLWLPEMPEFILLDTLLQAYHYEKSDRGELEGVIGELDDPYHQDKHLLTINFSEGNALVYGAAGSGKEMLLEAMISSLYENYGPDELNAYLLDFDAEALQAFRSAPQTGGIVLDGEAESIRSFFGMMQKELKRRKKLFFEYGGDYSHYQASGQEKVPYILAVLHNYPHFYENYEAYDDILTALTRECPKFGIYFVLTGTSASAIRYRLAQNFSQVFVLQLNDNSDYTSILGRTNGIYPSRYQGRGIIKKDEVYVFQTACLTKEKELQTESIKKRCDAWRNKYPLDTAKAIPVVPKFVSGAALANTLPSFERLPLGISFSTYSPVFYNMKERNILYVLSKDEKLLSAFTGGILEAVSGINDLRIVAISASDDLKKHVHGSVEMITVSYEDAVVELFHTAVERNNEYKKAAGKPHADKTPIFVVLNEYGRIKKQMSEDGEDKLKVMLAKTASFCEMYFVVTDTERNAGAYTTEEWVGERCGGNGVWLGTGIEDQIRFIVSGQRFSRQQPTDRHTGYFVDRTVAEKLRFVEASSLETEVENEE